MKQIHITRDISGRVTFETVSIDSSETVFFTNLDPTAAHWPDISSNRIGPAPSPNSSQCTVNALPPQTVTYTCKLHPPQVPGTISARDEQGTINVFNPLAAATTTLPIATAGTAIAEQTLVTGGMAPYAISGELFQVLDGRQAVIQSGSGIGPGLQLHAKTSAEGITVTGTPTVVGTYIFTFTVNDAMRRNLQQVQYSMVVNAASI